MNLLIRAGFLGIPKANKEIPENLVFVENVFECFRDIIILFTLKNNRIFHGKHFA